MEKEKIIYILHNVWKYGFAISMLPTMLGVVTRTFEILVGAVILAVISVFAKFFENQLIQDLKESKENGVSKS